MTIWIRKDLKSLRKASEREGKRRIRKVESEDKIRERRDKGRMKRKREMMGDEGV